MCSWLEKFELQKKKISFELRMKILQTVRNNYAILGISPLNQSNQRDSFSKKVFFGFCLFICLMVLQFVYVFYFANGFMEYMDCFCSISAGISIYTCYGAIVFRKTTLFDGIGIMEKLIDSSKAEQSPCYSFQSW